MGKDEIKCMDCGRLKCAIAKFTISKNGDARCRKCYTAAYRAGKIERTTRQNKKSKIYDLWGDM